MYLHSLHPISFPNVEQTRVVSISNSNLQGYNHEKPKQTYIDRTILLQFLQNNYFQYQRSNAYTRRKQFTTKPKQTLSITTNLPRIMRLRMYLKTILPDETNLLTCDFIMIHTVLFSPVLMESEIIHLQSISHH